MHGTALPHADVITRSAPSAELRVPAELAGLLGRWRDSLYAVVVLGRTEFRAHYSVTPCGIAEDASCAEIAWHWIVSA